MQRHVVAFPKFQSLDERRRSPVPLGRAVRARGVRRGQREVGAVGELRFRVLCELYDQHAV